MDGLTKKERRGRWTTLAVLLVGFAATFLLNPIHPLGGGKMCGFLKMTGLPCPTCGMTRAMCCISHGMYEESLYFNHLGFVLYAASLMSVMVVGTELATDRKFKWYRPRRVWWIVIVGVTVLLIVWTVKMISTTRENPLWAKESLVYRVFK